MQKTKRLTVMNLAFVALETLYWILILLKVPYGNEIVSFHRNGVLLFTDGTSLKKQSFFIPLGLFFTCCADYCLVMCVPQKTLPSLFFFSCVQIFYAIQIIKDLKQSGKKTSIKGIILARIAVSLVFTAAPVIILGQNADAVAIITLFYFSNLVMNLICCCLDAKRNCSLIIGLICFICCDILVGLGYADGVYFNIPKDSLLHGILYSGVNLIWLFYVPSQTLISLFAQKVKHSKTV